MPNFKLLLTDWRTTLFGILGGAVNLYVNGLSWKQALLSAALVGLGYVAKDSATTVSAPPTK